MPTKETELVEVSFEVDTELYEKAKEIIEKSGITMDEAVTLFFKAVIAYGRIPFNDK